MTKWSVVACDQFTAQREYWDRLDREIGDADSTLRLMLPEAYLGERDPGAEAVRINAEMRRYLERGVFREVPDSLVYLERTLPAGAVRRGLVGVLDLEYYDYRADAAVPVRATEGTVESRLPPRVEVRRDAALELPHVMVFFDDPSDAVLGPLTAASGGLETLYSFDLNAGGGHVLGRRVTGAAADRAEASLAALPGPVVYAIGDGNHSLATAKLCWEELKGTLSPAERESHPARFSLVELVNIHDPVIVFEPIHRCLLGTDPAAFLREAKEVFTERYRPGEQTYPVRLVTAELDVTLPAPAASIGALIAAAEAFCRDYTDRHGGRVEYIHNDEAVLEVGRRPGGAGLLLPPMEKGELFPSIARSGPFPRKSFSIGRAEEKRYYLECRKIKP